MPVVDAMMGEAAKALAASLSGVVIAGAGRLMQLVQHKLGHYSGDLPADPEALAELLNKWADEDPEWAEQVMALLARRTSGVDAVVPPPDPFHDRERERAEIPEKGITVFAGLNGCGKTALVGQIAAERAAKFPIDRCSVDLDLHRDGEVLRVAEAKQHVLRQLATAEIANAEPELSDQYWSVVAHRRMVLVLDNALGVEEIRTLAPGWPETLVLVTTRRLTDDLRAKYRCVELDGLDEAGAWAMLADKLGSLAPIMLEEPEQTRELLRRFGKMPFAIEQLGAILQKRAGTPNVVSTVLARFARTGITDTTDLIAHMLADTVGLLSEDMATAFVELAAHPRGEFTEESADALLGRSAERIVDELRAVGLVSPSWQGRHRMHWYAKRYAAELAEQRGIDTGAAFDRVLAFYARRAVAADMVDEDRLRCYTVPEVEPWPAGLNRVDWLDAEAKVLAELAELAADRGRDEEVGQLCAGLEILMLHRGRYQLCLQALDAGVRAATVLDNRALLGRQHGLRGRALTMLHIFDRAQSELDTAWQIVGTVDNPRLVSSTCEMFGRLFEEQVDYQGTQDYTAAINAFDRALVIDRENRDHRATALHARMKANAMTKGGCAGEAPPLLTEAWKLLLEQDNRNRSRVCLVWAKAAVAMRDPVTASTQLELSRRYADEAKATSYWAETTEVAATLAELTGDRAAARSRWGELVQYYVDNGHPRSLRYQRRLNELAQ